MFAKMTKLTLATEETSTHQRKLFSQTALVFSEIVCWQVIQNSSLFSYLYQQATEECFSDHLNHCRRHGGFIKGEPQGSVLLPSFNHCIKHLYLVHDLKGLALARSRQTEYCKIICLKLNIHSIWGYNSITQHMNVTLVTTVSLFLDI